MKTRINKITKKQLKLMLKLAKIDKIVKNKYFYFLRSLFKNNKIKYE